MRHGADRVAASRALQDLKAIYEANGMRTEKVFPFRAQCGPDDSRTADQVSNSRMAWCIAEGIINGALPPCPSCGSNDLAYYPQSKQVAGMLRSCGRRFRWQDVERLRAGAVRGLHGRRLHQVRVSLKERWAVQGADARAPVACAPPLTDPRGPSATASKCQVGNMSPHCAPRALVGSRADTIAPAAKMADMLDWVKDFIAEV